MHFARTICVMMLLFLLGCSSADVPDHEKTHSTPAAVPQVDPEFDARVRELIRRSGKHCGFDVVAPYQEELLQLGERAFPIYEAILADPKSDDRQVFLTCKAIERVRVDRRQFIPLAVKRLTAEDAMYVPEEGHQRHDVKVRLARRVYDLLNERAWARCTVIRLISEIGDEREATVIAPFLTNGADSVRYAAARAVMIIGTHRELDALNACLKEVEPRRTADELKHVTECRDALAKRLKEHPVPKNLTN